MFYSSYLFVKKGPLAGLWLAAHWQRKLTKIMITQTNLMKAKAAIEQPETPLALRVSGQLLLGLVRIYDRKVRYLQEDCSEAITTLKQAYRAGRAGTSDSVNLPPDAQQGAYGVINLPDHADDDVNLTLPDIDIDELLRDHSAAQLDDDLYGLPTHKKKRSRAKKSVVKNGGVEEEEEETDEDSVIMSQTKQRARHQDITLEDITMSQSSHPLLGDEDLLDGIGILNDDDNLEIEIGRDDIQQRSRIEDEEMMPLEMEDDVVGDKANQSAINLADVSIAESSRPSMIPASPEPDDIEHKYDEQQQQQQQQQQSPKKRAREQLTEEEELDAIELDVVDDDVIAKMTAEQRAKTKSNIVQNKKQRIERVDASTEVSGKEMAAWIADPSNLVIQRPTVPCTRAARMLQDITNLPSHLDRSATYPLLPSELTSLLTLSTSHRLKKISPTELNKRSERVRTWRTKLLGQDSIEEEEDHKTVVVDELIDPVEDAAIAAELLPEESEENNVIPDDMPLNDSIDIDDNNNNNNNNNNDDIPAASSSVAAEEDDIQSIRSIDDRSLMDRDATRDEIYDEAARRFFSEKSEPVEEDGNETADEAMEQDQKKQQQVGTDLSLRTRKMHTLLSKMMRNNKSNTTTLDAVIQTAPKNQRHIAAIVFQQLLVLKTHDFVEVEQAAPYQDITIEQTSTFKKAFTGRAVAV